MPTDIAFAIVPKSDQLNADDLIAGPITVRLGRARVAPGGEQPVSIDVEDVTGTPRKPWRPCKSMLRLLTEAWGTSDADQWIGRYVRLVRDPSVKYGGSEVGGIRVSGLSDVPANFTAQLTVTRSKRAPYRVEKLTSPASTTRPQPSDADPLAGLRTRLTSAGINAQDALNYADAVGMPLGTADERKALFTALTTDATHKAAFAEFVEKVGGESGGAS